MNHTEARQALLLRAFEAPLTAPWTDADRAWATREATRVEGEGADTSRLLARRAALALPRLSQQDPAVAWVMSATQGIPVPWLWLLLAFGLGLAMDSIGTQRTINLFALPLLGMLAWNIAVYVALLLHALRSLALGATGAADAVGAPTRGPVRQAMAGALAVVLRVGQRLSGGAPSPAVIRFLADWWQLSRPLQTARVATLLHLGAAAVAAGALASMYVRGVFFDFRAGWESTFFDAGAMHRAIGWLLGPAAMLSGVDLPNLAEFAALRLPTSNGESAQRWIHLFAITVAAVVIVPRALLASFAAWQAARRSRAMTLPPDDAYFTRLARELGGQTVQVQVLPYNYQAAPALRDGVLRVLQDRLGTRVQVRWSAVVPLGAEDDLDAFDQHATAPVGPGAAVALFALTATPERETHAAFVRALAARLAPGRDLIVLVDESGFRQRFTATDGAARLSQRRAAWQAVMHEIGHAALFVDLAQPEVAA